jgi:hypothetical protein
MIAKCENPACRVASNHHIGGKFFRFHVTEVEVFEIPEVFSLTTWRLAK